ncbi:MAG: LysM domain [Candidatus Sumerlaeota bacterium]|nr:LysM domain [Candidatus Sumerlaeota bacterium]
MSARTTPLLTALLLTAATATFVGCSSKPENSPVIRKKFAEVESLKDEVAETNKMIRTLAGDITIMKDEVSNLRALAPDGKGGTELITRLDALERRLAEMEVQGTTMAAARVQPAGTKEVASASFNGLAVPTAKAPETKKETAKPAPAKAAPKTTASAPKPAAKTVSKPAKPAGRYYTIQAGDSLEKIASSNGVSVASLRDANRLPAGARPLKGQRLYIPAGK